MKLIDKKRVHDYWLMFNFHYCKTCYSELSWSHTNTDWKLCCGDEDCVEHHSSHIVESSEFKEKMEVNRTKYIREQKLQRILK